MLAIFKKELKSYLTSMIGYVIIAFILAMAGIYFTAYNLNSAYPWFAYVLNYLTFVYFVVVPIITMRSLAEESRQKTDQLLLTSPVSVEKVVMGKYLSTVALLCIPLGIMCLYPLIMSQFGTIQYASTYSAILGFFLLGCAYLAIGLFISSITESQVLAAVITFGVLYASNIMSGISSLIPTTASTSLFAYSLLLILCCYGLYRMLKNIFIPVTIGVIIEIVMVVAYFVKSSIFEGSIQNFLEAFNINSHISNFYNDMLDIGAIVYFLSVIALFLFLTVQSIQKRRWS